MLLYRDSYIGPLLATSTIDQSHTKDLTSDLWTPHTYSSLLFQNIKVLIKNAKVTLNVDLLIIEHGWIGVDEFNDLPDIGKILAILICPARIG